MSFNPKIGIIGGKGKMGRLFASFFSKNGIKTIISDKNTKLSNIELAKTADITIISVPIDQTEKVIKEVAPHIPKTSALMDFTSIKEMPLKEMLKIDCEVLGMHPMFGETNPVQGQTLIVCETKKSGKWSKWIQDFLKSKMVKIVKMEPKEHDETMSAVQGLIHFSDIAFIDCLRKIKPPLNKILKYTSLSSELKIALAARIINQDANLYGNMQICNPNNPAILKQYMESIQSLFKIIKKKNLTAFTTYFKSNQKEFKAYSNKAFKETSYLIDKILELRAREKKSNIKPLPKKNMTAVLGPKNTFSEIATSIHAPQSQKFLTETIEEIFELVEKGKVKEGVCPIENNLHGTVRETLDALFSKNVHISEEFTMPIHHSLLTLPSGRRSIIKTIISHSQAINQCGKFLKKNFPQAQKIEYPSTASAIQKLLNGADKTIAVIAHQSSAKKFGLKCLAENIEDKKNNETKFIVIKRGNVNKLPAKKKILTAFYFDKDSPGSLSTVFSDFAKSKINLSKIESRPAKSNYGEYIFFLEFEGDNSIKKIKSILKKLEKRVANLKILGAY